MGRISALTELTSLASDDYLVVLDSSANIAKKITVANAFGIQEYGWLASGESWTYASWNSTTRTGTITVPSDATTKYKQGDRIKITQSTGGTKYGIITKVASTLLTVFFKSGTTFNNEAITSPSWALAGVNPTGFPTDETLWQLKYSSSSDSSQVSPTVGVWYNLCGSLTLGPGVWRIYHKVLIAANGTGSAASPFTTLSTTNNSETDADTSGRHYYQGNALSLQTAYPRKTYSITTDTTYYGNAKVDVAASNLQTFAISGNTIIEATCALL